MKKGFTPLEVNGSERKHKANKPLMGFTIIELLVSISIIAILLAIVLLNYKEGQQKFTLKRAAHKLAQDIRRVQAKAGEEFVGCQIGGGGYQDDYKYGYGIYFEDKPEYKNKYILFADCDGDAKYDKNQDEPIEGENVELEKGIEIESFSPQDGKKLAIIFVPPDPLVGINDKKDELDKNLDKEAYITLIISGTTTPKQKITVNKAGLIDITKI